MGRGERRGREMERKLYEAAITGDLSSLDVQLRERIKSLISTAEENPLHIASWFGHVGFVEEVLRLNPSLARGLNSQRLSPLHVASSKGHVEVAKALLDSDPDVCFIRDQKGRTPLHIAAEKGQVKVLTALVEAQPKAAWVMTDGGDPILHLCINHNQLEALKVLVEKVPQDNGEFVNLKDDDGNTILHLLASKNQHEFMKAFVKKYKDQLDVDAVNVHGFTSLDISMQHPTGSNRHKVNRILERANAKEAKQLSQPTVEYQERIRNLEAEDYQEWLSRTRETLLVVAILMATVTFQAGMNPPGGVWQSDEPQHDINEAINAGEAIMSYRSRGRYLLFIICNSLGFVSSLSLIVVLVGRFSFHQKVALWTAFVWITVISILVIYTCSVFFLTSANVGKDWSKFNGPFWSCSLVILTAILVLVRFPAPVRWILKSTHCLPRKHLLGQCHGEKDVELKGTP